MVSKSTKYDPRKVLRPLTFKVVNEKMDENALNCSKIIGKKSPSWDLFLMEPRDV